MIVLLVISSWLVVGAVVALIVGAAVNRGERLVDPPMITADSWATDLDEFAINRVVAAIDTVYDELSVLENEQLDRAAVESNVMVKARLNENSRRVQIARQVVSELRDTKTVAL